MGRIFRRWVRRYNESDSSVRRLSPNSAEARLLRQEVHFSCPACGSPILTYHHFDPPWREKEHNDPAGIIALCVVCHGEAEGGRWTRAELHELKKTAPTRSTIKKDFPWRVGPKQKIIYRLGGHYGVDTPILLALNGRPILREERSPDGLALFSLDVFNSTDELQLQICQNSMSVDVLDLWDVHLTTDGNRIIARRKKGEIALDLRLRRIAPVALTALFERDRADPEDGADPRSHLPSELLAQFERLGIDIASLSARPTPSATEWFMEYARRNCLDADGNAVVVDIANASLYSSGRHLLIRDGIQVEGAIFGANTAIECAVAFNL